MIIDMQREAGEVKKEMRKDQNHRRHSTAQHSTVQYSTVQYSTVQYSTVQYSIEYRNAILIYCRILHRIVYLTK